MYEFFSQNFGNYVICNEVVGGWDFQGLREVSLRDSTQLGISQVNFGAQNVRGNEIGTAKVRGFAYHSGVEGTPTGQFKIYIFGSFYFSICYYLSYKLIFCFFWYNFF